MKKKPRRVKRIKKHRKRYTTRIGVDFIYKQDLTGSITVVLNDSVFDIPAGALVEFMEYATSQKP